MTVTRLALLHGQNAQINTQIDNKTHGCVFVA